jgi:hypothetical protein
MSTASKLRHPKAPSPESGRPRKYGIRATYRRFSLTEMMRQWWVANATLRPHKGGAFGGCTVAERKRRRAARVEWGEIADAPPLWINTNNPSGNETKPGALAWLARKLNLKSLGKRGML